MRRGRNSTARRAYADLVRTSEDRTEAPANALATAVALIADKYRCALRSALRAEHSASRCEDGAARRPCTLFTKTTQDGLRAHCGSHAGGGDRLWPSCRYAANAAQRIDVNFLYQWLILLRPSCGPFGLSARHPPLHLWSGTLGGVKGTGNVAS